jgi:cell division cycle 14
MTLARCTLGICTDLPSTSMRSSARRKTRTDQLYFGVKPIQEVRCRDSLQYPWLLLTPASGRANASCLLACYMVLVQGWPPHLALAPIAQIDPPLMPFRDAGYSQADYSIGIQDVVYGLWKAKEEKCCILDNFNLDEYEMFERVEHGDFNWITPHFLAFASPQHTPTERITETMEEFAALPRTLDAVDAHPSLPKPMKNVLKHFTERNIGLVVRLNSPLYSPSYFEALGIQHLDMIFEDGTCPPLSMVKKFIRMAHEMITVRKKGIAVHCKAGLGRTGCLIGAYLIYRHGFTADEIIAYMRFMRPGMVVGPQQHWLHLNQGIFREWWIEERIERRLRKELMAAAAPSTPIRAMQKTSLSRSAGASTPPTSTTTSRTPLSEVDQGRKNAGVVQEDYLPAPTPGQPRKTTRSPDRHHPYHRTAHNGTSHSIAEEDSGIAVETTETISVEGGNGEEEWRVRMRTHRTTSPTASPNGHSQHSRERNTATDGSNRSVSHSSTTTTTTIYQIIDNDASKDIENIGAVSARKVIPDQQRASSASGVLAKVRGTTASATGKRSADSMRVGKEPAGIRKTSGRVGSVSSASASSVAAVAAVRKVSGV